MTDPATDPLTDAPTISHPTNGSSPGTVAVAETAAAPSTGIIAHEERQASVAITAAITALDLTAPPVFDLRPIPFAGTWGAASSVCRALASEVVTRDLEASGDLDGLSKKEIKRKVNEVLPARAQELAEAIAAHILAQADHGFAAVEAINGYVNISFDANAVAARLIGEVLDLGPTYGHGAPIATRVMVEHSQLNTHKAAHVGHLRNICLGVALTNIVGAAGYQAMPVTYIGDIGMHVVKCLWCYERFHHGQEPSDPAARGRWLGDIYAEADARLAFRKDVLEFIQLLAREDQAFALAIDRMLKYLWRKGVDGLDIAYLLGRFTHAQEIKEDMFTEEDVIPRFWPILGDQLRDELVNQKPYVPVEGIPEPTTTPEERLATWEALALRMDDWWLHVPAWRQEIKDTFQRWECKDPDFVALWETTRQWSLDDLGRIFAEFGATFDHWFFESGVEEPGRRMVQDLLNRGIAEISDGLPVVKIDQKLGLTTETYRTLPILRSDGTTLYATKDLALTRQKFEEFGVDRALWVVDLRQSLYFHQITQILGLAGYEQAAKAEYVGYEFVTLPDGVISSRKGSVPLFEDLERVTLERAHAVIAEKNPDLPEADKDRVARQVGIGAIQYAMLARDNAKVIVYDPEEALSFDGHAGPYIQYAHARASRILERADIGEDGVIASLDGLDFGALEPAELSLLQQIAALPEEIQRAAAEFKPLLIASYVFDLAKRFNDFYHACPVLQSEEPTRTARLALVAATRRTLANGLGLLGIAAPHEM